MGSETVESLDVVTIIEVPFAIERWLAAGGELGELGLLIQERPHGARVVAMQRTELESAGLTILDDAGALRALLEEALAAARPEDIPTIIEQHGNVTVGLLDLRSAQADAARATLEAPRRH